jgi:hypothetical protein
MVIRVYAYPCERRVSQEAVIKVNISPNRMLKVRRLYTFMSTSSVADCTLDCHQYDRRTLPLQT